MKILLVKPYNLSDHIQPSLGLGYLATAVKDKAEVKILDCIKEGVDISKWGKKISAWRPDLIGLQCYTFDLKFIKEAINIAKGINSNIVTVIGGPHPSALPSETMDFFSPHLDFAFCGEAEKGFAMLIDGLNGKKIPFSDIPGLIWKNQQSITINTPFFENDLDSLGRPAWEMIRPETYPESQHGAFYKKFPIAPIMLTRGCPYECSFCAGKLVSGRKLRKRGIKNVIAEIKQLYYRHGIRELHIIDDNFTLDRNYAKTFLRELITQNLDISWATPNGIRMDTVDEEMLELMKQSGLYLISLGIESGSDRVLQLMKKNLSTEKIRRAIELIRHKGIETAGFFILGFPGEKKEEISQTIDFSLGLDLIRANYFTYLPFPGTESYWQLSKEGGLDKVDWKKFYFMNAAYTPKGIGRKELKRLQRTAFLRFYLRPRIFWKNLMQIKTFDHFKFLLRRFFHWIIMA